jgi:hypothetical protein
MTLVFWAELKVWWRPSEESTASFAIRLLVLTPSRKALLVTVSSACGQEGVMTALLCFLADH